VKPSVWQVFGEVTNQSTWSACVSHFVFSVRLRRLLREDALARLAPNHPPLLQVGWGGSGAT
jgi:hypothetical protein